MEENLNQNITPSVEPVVVTPTPSVNQPPFGSWWKVGILVVGVLLAGSITYAGYQYSQKQPKPTSYPTILPTPTPTPDPTEAWKTYTNTAYDYSVKYPTSFTTELVAGDAGHKEADSTARSLFIYQSDTFEPYLNRYINIEVFQLKSSYNEGTITEVTLDNRKAQKIIIASAKFDIYSAQISNNMFIEIYVSNDPTKKDLANQILSTFQFTE